MKEQKQLNAFLIDMKSQPWVTTTAEGNHDDAKVPLNLSQRPNIRPNFEELKSYQEFHRDLAGYMKIMNRVQVSCDSSSTWCFVNGILSNNEQAKNIRLEGGGGTAVIEASGQEEAERVLAAKEVAIILEARVAQVEAERDVARVLQAREEQSQQKKQKISRTDLSEEGAEEEEALS